MIRVLIVDDEEHSRITLTNMLTRFCENVTVAGEAESVAGAVAKINRLKPDLVFLDIEMPQENGFQLFNYFDRFDFDVIFTTAYDQYALKAFKFSAIDYLLKPIDIQELRTALVKFENKKDAFNKQDLFNNLKFNITNDLKKITLPTTDGLAFVQIDDIVRFEADNNYTTAYTLKGEKYLIAKTLKEYEELLADLNFFRLSRSQLINLKHIKRYRKSKRPEVEMADGAVIDLPTARRKELLDRLNSF